MYSNELKTLKKLLQDTKHKEIQEDVKILIKTINLRQEKTDTNSPYITKDIKLELDYVKTYNPEYANTNIPCKCGHSYDRHFDSYENWEAVGCKYCGCYEYEPATPEQITFNSFLIQFNNCKNNVPIIPNNSIEFFDHGKSYLFNLKIIDAHTDTMTFKVDNSEQLLSMIEYIPTMLEKDNFYTLVSFFEEHFDNVSGVSIFKN